MRQLGLVMGRTSPWAQLKLPSADVFSFGSGCLGVGAAMLFVFLFVLFLLLLGVAPYVAVTHGPAATYSWQPPR